MRALTQNLCPTKLLSAMVLFCAALMVPSGASAQTPELRVVELFEELASSLDSNEDCDRVEKALRSWADAHGDELKSLVDETGGGTRDIDPEVAADVEARMGPAMHTIFSATMACGEHDGTLEAMSHIDQMLNGTTADASATDDSVSSE